MWKISKNFAVIRHRFALFIKKRRDNRRHSKKWLLSFSHERKISTFHKPRRHTTDKPCRNNKTAEVKLGGLLFTQ